MPLDLDLQELRRRVAAEPEHAAARIELAAALARCGSKDDAAAELWRARSLGGEARVCLDALKALGARASPWTHAAGGDSERTNASPLVGPRRGEVVASSGEIAERPGSQEAFRVALDEDGTVLLATDSELVALDSRTLAPRARAPVEHAHLVRLAVAGAGRVFAANEGRGTVALLDETRTRPRALEVETRIGDVAVDSAGHVVIAAWSPGEREPRRIASLKPALDGLATRFAGRASWRSVLPVHEGRVALFEGRRLRVLELDGSEERGANLEGEGLRCAFALDGSVVVLEVPGARRPSAVQASALDPLGRIAWTVHVPSASSQSLALGRSGAVWLRTTEELVKLEGSRIAWRRVAPRFAFANVLVDREDVSYTSFPFDDESPALIALDPADAPLFLLRGVEHPFAIDAWGRLLARRGREIVAIV